MARKARDHEEVAAAHRRDFFEARMAAAGDSPRRRFHVLRDTLLAEAIRLSIVPEVADELEAKVRELQARQAMVVRWDLPTITNDGHCTTCRQPVDAAGGCRCTTPATNPATSTEGAVA